jgi:hypothetical protein
MASFDTLIRLDTLTRTSSAGSYRQNIDMEVKVQHDNSCKYQRKGA